MKIAIGSDHRGFKVKERLTRLLSTLGHVVQDEGPTDNSTVDYPDFASAVGEKVSKNTVDRGILICGTGIGMAITANKFSGVRAATCYDEMTAEVCRRHNDANVLCLSGDMLGEEQIDRMVEVWLNTQFEGGRHARRLEKITAIEQSREK